MKMITIHNLRMQCCKHFTLKMFVSSVVGEGISQTYNSSFRSFVWESKSTLVWQRKCNNTTVKRAWQFVICACCKYGLILKSYLSSVKKGTKFDLRRKWLVARGLPFVEVLHKTWSHIHQDCILLHNPLAVVDAWRSNHKPIWSWNLISTTASVSSNYKKVDKNLLPVRVIRTTDDSINVFACGLKYQRLNNLIMV